MSKNNGLWITLVGWLWPKPISKNPATKSKIVPDIPKHLGHHEVKPVIRYEKISILEKTPSTNALSDSDFVVVIYKGKEYWSIFKCPCGCGEMISLSLAANHKPHWSAKQSIAKRPTLFPSVWQLNGCNSHFWIDDGRVYWCGDTGVLPWVARPDVYSKPK